MVNASTTMKNAVAFNIRRFTIGWPAQWHTNQSYTQRSFRKCRLHFILCPALPPNRVYQRGKTLSSNDWAFMLNTKASELTTNSTGLCVIDFETRRCSEFNTRFTETSNEITLQRNKAPSVDGVSFEK